MLMRGITSSALGSVVATCLSPSKGMKKTPVAAVRVIAGHGIVGDAHAGDPTRQISLLAIESIQKMIAKGLNVGPGDFAENITTQGIDLLSLPIGAKITIGDEAEVEVSQIGKVCHTRCAIYTQAGDCVMPKEGIFAKVLKGGVVKEGDEIKIVQCGSR